MVSPCALAQPAELKAALTAGHVHAALVLLDGPLALGALLGVRQDPVQIFALGAVLDQPLPDCVACHLEHHALVWSVRRRMMSMTPER